MRKWLIPKQLEESVFGCVRLAANFGSSLAPCSRTMSLAPDSKICAPSLPNSRFFKLFGFIICFLFLVSCSASRPKSVFLAILPENNELTLPRYLECLEKLDYPKKSITIYFHPAASDDESGSIVQNWIENHQKEYKQVILDREIDAKHRSGILLSSNIKDRAIQAGKKSNCDYFFMVHCGSLIAPNTLKVLIEKQKPIIAPMLLAIPEINDPFSNYFSAVTESGYYQDHPEYWLILNQIKTGTFLVPLVHTTYLIEKKYLDQLSYMDGSETYDFIVFGKNVRKQQIPQYICNEEPFGVLFHFSGDLRNDQAEKERLKHILSLPSL